MQNETSLAARPHAAHAESLCRQQEAGPVTAARPMIGELMRHRAVVVHIARALHVDDIVRLSRTCRALHRALRDDVMLIEAARASCTYVRR